MDRFDAKILTVLQENGRASLSEIADAVALTTTPCARRIQRLENGGVIEGYTATLNQSSVGFPITVLVELSLGGKSERVMEQFEKQILGVPEVVECFMTSGRSDYLLKVVAESLDGYYDFLRERILSIPDVENVETSFVLHKVMDRKSLPLIRVFDNQ